SSGAAPIWADVMAGLHAQLPSVAPAPPSGLVQQHVQFVSASSPSPAAADSARLEWFIAGTQQASFQVPALVSDAVNHGPARILQPVSGSILALDPDIPPERQQLRLLSNRDHVRWRINGKTLAQGREAY